MQLVSAIELLSPANKDRASHRRAVAAKCAAYLQENVSVVIVDVVTERQANLHADIMRLLELNADAVWESPTQLYAVAYRTVGQDETARLELWPEVLRLGEKLPTMPLWLGTDVSMALDLEQSYQATCETLRINGV